MNTATYLDTSHRTPRPLSPGRHLAGRVAVAAAAIARASLRSIAVAAEFNRRLKAAAHLDSIDPRLVRDIGFNHRGEIEFAGRRAARRAPAGLVGTANDNVRAARCTAA